MNIINRLFSGIGTKCDERKYQRKLKVHRICMHLIGKNNEVVCMDIKMKTNLKVNN